MKKYQRRIKLIEPRLQLRMTFVFVGLAAMALLLQYILFTRTLANVALSLPEDGMLLMDKINGVLIGVLVTSFLLFLPLIFTVGVLTTFRIAGPMYRFRLFLNSILEGRQSTPCRIRDGDEFQDFCDLLNQVTEPLRNTETDDSENRLEAVTARADPHDLRRSA